MIDDGEPRKPATAFAIGEDLTMLSIEELERRITVLGDEIRRLESAIAGKKDSRTTAETFFRS